MDKDIFLVLLCPRKTSVGDQPIIHSHKEEKAVTSKKTVQKAREIYFDKETNQ